MTIQLLPNTVLHRIGGASIDNLRLKEVEHRLIPPGLSLLLGGTPQAAAEQMRHAFPRARRLQAEARVVGTATAEAIRTAGFDLLLNPTNKFPNHVRLIHPLGAAGFTDENLSALVAVFYETTGC